MVGLEGPSRRSGWTGENQDETTPETTTSLG